MKVSDFDFQLPEDLIAQQPCQKRDCSRLLILSRRTGTIEHKYFYHLPELLRAGDLLVLNDTKVLPARLFAAKDSGGRLELLLLTPGAEETWHCLVKPARRARVGTRLTFAGGLQGEIVAAGEQGQRTVRFSLAGAELQKKIEEIGQLPLPPYIRRPLAEPDRYQTVYAARPGAVAAPTAGLHFTDQVFARLKARGIDRVFLTLHVGLGTFRPVTAETVEEHRMHSEYYQIDAQAAAAVNRARAEGRRVVAVGTTAVRVLETAAGDDGLVRPGSGWTDIFIYPGYSFKAVDALLTNFHLPRSTLLMLVSAFAGRELVLQAYQEAIARKYRFFSFGDAMLIV
ncbi:MAG TPA: tRNA preQ1(34) S-adenosylmethionine ribosyltransferase-isomerase QueA [Bacillota bacterium]|nr:tRNA preQ1(34) S-adenosylmethionine ribosyltransferase-isomerase QueA [Bacillota bacterium]HPZ90768.1 tRNA preQ1(34) S-adenosylmethionine ribosyltransferase-isomerase QueA [Bacillota bacterium]HQE01722.1 tRNA preQ1(34) S-adenosylmethionine ribosyltransferase-isomerase QueA [Bacillota bacterium]